MIKRLYILLLALCLFGQTMLADTLTIDSCLSLARQNNPSLRKAQLDILRAQEVKSQALTKYFPQVQGMAFGYHALQPIVDVGIDDIGNASVRDLLTTLYGNYGAALGLDNSINLFQYGYSAGVTAIQPVFMGGKIVAGNQLAKVGVEAAKLQAEIGERDVLEQVEQTYWLVYGLQQKQQLIDEALTLLDTLALTVSVAVEAGLALPSDSMQVALRRDEVLSRQIQLRSGLSLARQALSLSLGLPVSDTIVAVETQESDDPFSLASETASVSPEAQLLALQVRANQLQRRMTLGDALPQLAVGANYSYSRFQTNVLRDQLGSPTGNGAVFVTMRVPLTAWWETAHKLKEQDYAIQQAQLDADYLGAQLDLRTQQAADQLVQAQSLIVLQQSVLTHAEEAYRLLRLQYEAGMATISDLLRQQVQLTQAQSDLTDARLAYRLALRRYNDLK